MIMMVKMNVREQQIFTGIKCTFSYCLERVIFSESPANPFGGEAARMYSL